MSWQREQYWVVDGICQVCLGDQFHHVISSDQDHFVYWCDARKILELGLQVEELDNF